jgi:hypothetical protein
MADPKPDSKNPLTAEDAVKLFAKQNITVNVVKTAKGGVSVRDTATKKFVTEDVALAAAHIVGINERAGEISITTADGRKYSASAK